MITIRLIDARRGLSLKCGELFKDERIAKYIYQFLCDGIEDCESVQPERKKGKWIKLYTGNYKCSECGDWWGIDDNDMVENFHYCPNCGAWMGGQDENNRR